MTPHQGLCPLTPLGTPPPDPRLGSRSVRWPSPPPSPLTNPGSAGVDVLVLCCEGTEVRVLRTLRQPGAAMSTRYDLCMVYDDDADQWSRYVLHHLGREHFRFRLLPVIAHQLLEWLTASRDGGAATPRLREASEARSFIVVVSPGLVRLMLDQPQFEFHQLVEEPSTAQVPV